MSRSVMACAPGCTRPRTNSCIAGSGSGSSAREFGFGSDAAGTVGGGSEDRQTVTSAGGHRRERVEQALFGGAGELGVVDEDRERFAQRARIDGREHRGERRCDTAS